MQSFDRLIREGLTKERALPNPQGPQGKGKLERDGL